MRYSKIFRYLFFATEAMSSENENEWLSAKEIAERGAVAGYPATEKGAMGHAKRKPWPSKVVPGKGFQTIGCTRSTTST